MNNIHVVSCPRSGSWKSLYDTLDNISKSNTLDFNIHVWAGLEPQDTPPICNNDVTVHINSDPPKRKNTFNGFLNYKRAMVAARLDDISIIIEDDIDVCYDWIDISLKALSLLDENALISMHHFYSDTNKFVNTQLIVDNVGIYKISDKSDVTGAQGYISNGNNWKQILYLVDLPEYSNIAKIQDVIMLKVWMDNYYILDPCIVKHREKVASTWLSYKMRTKHCIF